MTRIYPTSAQTYKREYAPRITPIELRAILWGKFGRKCYVKTRGHVVDVTVTDRSLLVRIAEIVARYEDLFDDPKAQRFNIIPLYHEEKI